MKKSLLITKGLFIAAVLLFSTALFTNWASAQQQSGKASMTSDEFAKEKIANICRYVDVNKEDSTKLHKVFVDYQKEAQASIADKEKLGTIVKGLRGKIEDVIGKEKYKVYKEKSLADQALKDKSSH